MNKTRPNALRWISVINCMLAVCEMLAPLIVWIMSVFIDISIAIDLAISKIYVKMLCILMYTNSNIIGATVDGKNVTLALRDYYNNDLHLTTSSAHRWLSRFIVQHAPIQTLNIMFKHNNEVHYAIVDLDINIERRTMSLLNDNNISLEYLYDVVRHVK